MDVNLDEVSGLIRQAVVEKVPGISPEVVERAVEESLIKNFAGERVGVFVPKVSRRMRRERRQYIQKNFNGRNTKQLARDTGLSARQVRRIVAPKRLR